MCFSTLCVTSQRFAAGRICAFKTTQSQALREGNHFTRRSFTPVDDMEAKSTALFSSCYELGSSLGSGSYGLVCDGIRKSDGLEVAIKHVPLQDITYVDTSKGEHLPKEVALQQELHKSETCPYIVKLYDWYLEDQLIMTMEYPRPCMTLHDFIKCHPSLPRETLARRLMTQAVMAAKYCIGHGVNHGDLSWDNFLINTDMMQVKIIDFGNGRFISTTNNLESGYCDSAYAVADTVCGLGNILALLVGCCCFTGVTHKHIVSEGKKPSLYTKKFYSSKRYGSQVNRLVLMMRNVSAGGLNKQNL
ncbi:serine/threonine-protein kinase pim-3-like isoform X4 [Triplophysa dalaica]|uniref:serine/threonine-protein kinase pim-3-like isoform X4 n=2 Tax=Triplophysa dalaica TaxID=1582913 RepID=UPI0024DFC7C9|nr:serine/threonine-protein kinase pim-3-like isoform X4 [Triplophysa dalaica]